ncbi:Blue copper protein [Sesamum alatum]|uniref:Blue copper protein n=1 Tax=Sesamum alatum TaxID=300844 RepID=A0AAE2CFI8_9LAMI|nr:Blue copper protein [Sesamum alatum]
MEGRLKVVAFMTLVLAAMLDSSSAQTTHVVGDSLGWLVPPGGEVAYRTWATSRTFTVGDVLVFNFTTGVHDAAEVSREAYDSCNSSSPISIFTNGPARITLTSAGEHHFICTFNRHCDFGQKLAINVSAASTAPAPQPATPPPAPAPETTPSPAVPATPPPAATPAPSPSRAAMTFTVGDSLGWTVPPGGPIAYQTWARGKPFLVGDILVFNFTNGAHDVVEVTRAEFDSCNVSSSTTNPITTSPARITLTSAGEHYYICTFSQHCTFGQKLAVNVSAARSTATPPSGSAPAPSSAATPPPPRSSGPTPANPSTPSTPSPVTAPPPPSNSAPSFAVAALPFTFLAVAVAFLYN